MAIDIEGHGDVGVTEIERSKSRTATFTQDLYDEAKKDGRVVISMKKDWKRLVYDYED